MVGPALLKAVRKGTATAGLQSPANHWVTRLASRQGRTAPMRDAPAQVSQGRDDLVFIEPELNTPVRL